MSESTEKTMSLSPEKSEKSQKTQKTQKAQKATKIATRFLPMRSKGSTISRYELLRHPRKCGMAKLSELYKYIIAPPDTILTTIPSIAFTSKGLDTSQELAFNDIKMIVKKGSNNVAVSPTFIERINKPGPFMGTIVYTIVKDDTINSKKSTQPINYFGHISTFIYFPDYSWLYILDTTAHTSDVINAIDEQLNNIIDKKIKIIDIAAAVYWEYNFMPFLQRDEPIGYCTAWSAGFMERVAPKINELQKETYNDQILYFKKLYDELMLQPTFGREFYNKLAMRSHGATRKAGNRKRVTIKKYIKSTYKKRKY